MATKKRDDGPRGTIEMSYDGEDYVLEFNRRTLSMLEKRYKVNIGQMLDGTVNLTDMELVFAASLKMHHPEVSASLANEMFAAMPDKGGLMSALVEILVAAISPVFEEPDGGKAASWTI